MCLFSWLGPAALLASLPSPPAGDLAGCQALRDDARSLSAAAIAAEVALLAQTRRRLCPELEPPAAESGQALADPEQELDLGALLSCRQAAERAVQASGPVLFVARGGFRFFTPDGAGQARAAQEQLDRLAQRGCPPP